MNPSVNRSTNPSKKTLQSWGHCVDGVVGGLVGSVVSMQYGSLVSAQNISVQAMAPSGPHMHRLHLPNKKQEERKKE